MNFFRAIILVFAIASFGTGVSAQKMGPYGVQTKETQAALSTGAALDLLKKGNERFVSGKVKNQKRYRKQVTATASGQFPFASILSCLDSRVTVEDIFDLNNGDAFSGRVAGNVMNPDMLGSFEFATKLAGAKVIVVLGHSSCGAVKGACDNAKLGNLTGLLDRLMPAVELVGDSWKDGEKNSGNANFVQAVSEANVRLVTKKITKDSPVIKALVDSGDVIIVGAMYDLKTGGVTFLDS